MGKLPEREVTSKTEANGPTHAITQHPSLASGRGPCVTADEVENVNRSQCLVMQREVYEACQTASLCPFVWVVFFGGRVILGVMELWHVTPHQEQRYLSISMCWRHRTQQSATSMLLGSRLSYVTFALFTWRWGQGQTCIMLFFVKCEQCTLPCNTACGWKSATPCDVKVQTGVKTFYTFHFIYWFNLK